MDAEETPATAGCGLHPADRRFGQNNRTELRPHAAGHALRDFQDRLRVGVRRNLDVGIGIHTAVRKPADVGDRAVGDKHRLVVDVGDLREPHPNLLHAPDDRRGREDFHHVAHLHRVPKNQREADHNILDQTLRTEADGQADDGGARQIGREVDPEFLQHQAEPEKVDRKGYGADHEPHHCDKSRFSRHEPERILLRVAAEDEPFAEEADGPDRQVGGDRQHDNQQKARFDG